MVSADYGLNAYTDKMFEVDTREEGKGWATATKVHIVLGVELGKVYSYSRDESLIKRSG